MAAQAHVTADAGFTLFQDHGASLTTVRAACGYATSNGGNNLDVYYNAVANQLEVNAAQVQGGFMSLTGHILNTNPNAQINVMDGYGRINIQNDINLPILINKLDTAEGANGVEGHLIIADTSRVNGAGAPLVSDYTRVGSNITEKQYSSRRDRRRR